MKRNGLGGGALGIFLAVVICAAGSAAEKQAVSEIEIKKGQPITREAIQALMQSYEKQTGESLTKVAPGEETPEKIRTSGKGEGSVTLVGLGADIVAREPQAPEAANQWKWHAATKVMYQFIAMGNEFDAGEAFWDQSIAAGGAIAATRGPWSLSFSTLAPLDEFEDRGMTTTGVAGVLNEMKATYDYVYTDFRLGYAVNRNLSVGLGYKAAFTENDAWEYNINRRLVESEHYDLIEHGPGLCLNGSVPVGGKGFSLWGSLFWAPYAWSEGDVEFNNYVLNTSDKEYMIISGWYANPEVGWRYQIPGGHCTLGGSYRAEYFDTYHLNQMNGFLSHGFALDFTLSF